ncbi:TRAP transporter small permease [Salipiger mangrovisoli]|uniref:TRAP transporter small permease protein n=1 Tax=Salipiger mangrovisoli TaxID=2865933 RepID=A0ABR9X6L5_9RHOB|nr:TRAP transporter small permease [Salipiger mangrovisoli]MBE9639151.1 TRAP transporter small permease [Salipiger mangrovisoli]
MSETTHPGGPASAGALFDWIACATQWLTGIALAALVLLVAGEAFLRGMANYSLGFAEEVSGYLVVALTFFGAALTLRSQALFQVNFLFDQLPAGARALIMRAFIVLSIGVCAVLAWQTFGLVDSSFSRGKFAPTVLRTPLWIPQLLMPLGFSVLGIFLVEQFLLCGRRSTAAGDDGPEADT